MEASSDLWKTEKVYYPPAIREIAFASFKALRNISKGNGLKGLNQEGRLLGIRDLSTDCGLGSLLRHLKIQTFRCFCHPMKLSSL